MSVRLGIRNTANGHLLYIYPHQVKKWRDVRSVEITLILEDKKSLGGEWKHIVALRERGEVFSQ